jgi:hypothetical protein
MTQFKGNKLNYKLFHFTQDWDLPEYPNQPRYFQHQITPFPCHQLQSNLYQPLSLKDAARRHLYWHQGLHLSLSRSLNPSNLHLFRFLTDLLGLYQRYRVEELSQEQYLRYGHRVRLEQHAFFHSLTKVERELLDLQDRLLETPRLLICLREELPPSSSQS